MKKLFATLLILCSALALHAEGTLYTTSFADWTSYTGSGQQSFTYSGITFTVNNVKVMPDQAPSSVSGASTGYIKPNTASSMSSSYVQTGRLDYTSHFLFDLQSYKKFLTFANCRCEKSEMREKKQKCEKKTEKNLQISFFFCNFVSGLLYIHAYVYEKTICHFADFVFCACFAR